MTKHRIILLGTTLAIAGVFTALALGFMTQTELGRYFWAWSERRVVRSQKIGDEIVAALDARFHESGIYPADLGTLVPEYLADIPAPRAGDKTWRYNVSDDGKSFVLSFALNDDEYPISHYYSEGRQWEVDQ